MSGSLTIVGLGPGDPELRTLGAQRALDAAERIILRTAIHPGVDDLIQDSRTNTCDDLYDQSASFDEVYAAVVERVLEAARTHHVVYGVPGHPTFGERTVAALRTRTADTDIPTTIQAGVSGLDAVSLALGVDLMSDEVQLLDATALDAWLHREPFGGGLLEVVPTRPVLVSQVYSNAIASAVKLSLSRVFPEDHLVKVVNAAGVQLSESVIDCPLHRLDHVAVDHLTSVWLPALSTLQANRSAATLHRLAGMLRAPNGCPWDRKQTHRSLRDAVIEEAHEVVDAIDEDDHDHLAEELGDLLIQVALHAQIAEEAGQFTIEDVYDEVNRKLVRRHPHVFADVVAMTAEDVIQTWQGVKAKERRDKGEAEVERTPFDRLPRSMPVLTRVAQVLDVPVVADTSMSTSELRNRLLSAVEALVAAGLDPERELERAFRNRSAVGV